jgi:hypothetical protein
MVINNESEILNMGFCRRQYFNLLNISNRVLLKSHVSCPKDF